MSIGSALNRNSRSGTQGADRRNGPAEGPAEVARAAQAVEAVEAREDAETSSVLTISAEPFEPRERPAPPPQHRAQQFTEPLPQLLDRQHQSEAPASATASVEAVGREVRLPPPGFTPMIANAPALNWTGPDDAWTRAWAAPAAQVEPPGPLPIPPPPSPQGIPAALLPSPQIPLPGSVVAVVPLSSRQRAAAARKQAGFEPQSPPPSAAPSTPDTGPIGPTPQDIVLIRRSLAAIEPVADRATAHFYAVLFLARPELRALFPAAMDVQRDKLFRALLAAGRAADDPAELVAYLEKLACGHRRYGVRDEHYAPVGAALQAALERYCGREWTPETAHAWDRVFALITRVMTAAAARDAQTSPAWWQGEVQSVQPVTRDIAVVTLRTDHPYPYRAGQYASVEVPWWPRVWRNYSLASPASVPTRAGGDGLLRLHVKAVPAGWVSNALVHRAQPGDVVRLGPPQGRMVVDPGESEPLLLVGGGTGIAPLLAIVEELALSGARRTVELRYGARRSEELYALAALRELDRRLPWLSVRSAVADPSPATRPEPGMERGALSEVIARSGPWDGYHACVSGPSAMIRRTRAVLLDAGVPAQHIRYDLEGGQM